MSEKELLDQLMEGTWKGPPGSIFEASQDPRIDPLRVPEFHAAFDKVVRECVPEDLLSGKMNQIFEELVLEFSKPEEKEFPLTKLEKENFDKRLKFSIETAEKEFLAAYEEATTKARESFKKTITYLADDATGRLNRHLGDVTKFESDMFSLDFQTQEMVRSVLDGQASALNPIFNPWEVRLWGYIVTLWSKARYTVNAPQRWADAFWNRVLVGMVNVFEAKREELLDHARHQLDSNANGDEWQSKKIGNDPVLRAAAKQLEAEGRGEFVEERRWVHSKDGPSGYVEEANFYPGAKMGGNLAGNILDGKD